MSKKRRFGRVRQLPSGRWQARYQGPDGIDRAAPETFDSKTDAEVWLTLKEAEIRSGDWVNPADGQVSLADYARIWIDERPDLRPKTVLLYRYLLRKHIAPVLGQVAIVDLQPGQVNGSGLIAGPPKSAAGKRVVAIPDVITQVIQWHLSCFAEDGGEGLIFTSPEGRPLHHSNFRRRVWLPALSAAGLAGIHFHDLRHTGNTLAASAGATLRELMDRMGHDSQRAAMIYLHGSDARQHEIAGSLSKLARDELNRSGEHPEPGKRSGTQRARNRKRAS